MRVRIDVAEELPREVDRVAGKRKRSRFVAAAIREKLTHEVRAAAFQHSAGVLPLTDYPEWATPAQASNWVRERRYLAR